MSFFLSEGGYFVFDRYLDNVLLRINTKQNFIKLPKFEVNIGYEEDYNWYQFGVSSPLKRPEIF